MASLLADDIYPNNIGNEIYGLIEELYPICRSITGDGVRQTLKIVQKHIPLTVNEVQTGTRVFDWTVPKEWNIRDAYIKDKDGNKVVDFNNSNLHVVNYSLPISKKLDLNELKKHLYSLPEHPDWIPYRTSYYNDTWGFCLTHNQLEKLNEGEYEVYIDSSLEDGSLTYAEYVLPGQIEDEILLSAHTCHPSLANDNLSGIAVLTFLAKYLSGKKHKYTYRFIFAPGTIGSITWLALNEKKIDHIKYGLVVSCVGDNGGPIYKRSRKGDTLIDKSIEHVLKHFSDQSIIEDFSPYGYDERQYCSPGFNLSVGLFERSKYGNFPQYHTSADNLDFISTRDLVDSLGIITKVLNILENNVSYLNTNPKCEPQLGKRGLYNAIGGDNDSAQKQLAILWILNLSDGSYSLLDIADRSKIPFEIILQMAMLLEKQDLLTTQ